jgi:hypothetical protein
MIAAENAWFKKQDVAGYAEVVDDTYIVHSERANSIRFHANMIDNRDYMSALQRAGIKTLIYTNDTDLKFAYDVKANHMIDPTPTDAGMPVAAAPDRRVETAPPVPAQPILAQDSLADAARRAKERKACLELAKDNPSITCK